MEFKDWGFGYAGGFGILFVVILSTIIGYKLGYKWFEIFLTSLFAIVVLIIIYWVIRTIILAIRTLKEK